MRKSIPIRKKISKKHIKYVSDRGYLQFNNFRDLQNFAEVLRNEDIQISPGELKCVELLSDISRYLLQSYINKFAENADNEVVSELITKYGKQQFLRFEGFFKEEFTNEDLILENIVVHISNENPAYAGIRTLFDDSSLKAETKYQQFISVTEKYFLDKQPVSDGRSIIELLKLPMQKHPNSLYDQLGFIKSNFSDLLGDFIIDISESMDALKEEITLRGGSPGLPEVYDFHDEPEYENFSEDKDWMSTLSLIAKSVYVWLAQLSRKYKKEISHLDQIPDEELRLLARRGFRGIWLIGIWERSKVSGKFKRIKGNPEALSSAYSLMKYEVADDLGGKEAMHNFKVRAGKFGMKIGCDLVPNHMAVDSDWVAEHPDWFIQTDVPPFPSYTFNSQNLSERDDVEVYLEDKYYDETDAAVVFKLVNRRDGKQRFIYHGNDGTSIPWSDTAQLNYLLPEVREAVINEIIKTAREFPVIRFDAAMTLAKKHFQRLWFPEPGNAGAIPSRHLYSMRKAEFNKVFQNEFWREVVDRIAEEVPDTLLLAEAFWMMEGYFVRTLGMHRVYNSAFMNMLKAEENGKYRESVKNIIDFNPEILKRFVNFMSNPDEETAIAQFGTDDKYFGVCVLMTTMPGLPMFAHGQIEGFTERYGMEYSKPKHWEEENTSLIEKHKSVIFPLLHKRKLFSDVQNFVFYDFRNEFGETNENIFAYSNEFEGQRTLVVYNNSYTEISGNVKYSETEKVFTEFGKAWHLTYDKEYFALFTDSITRKVYVHNSAELCVNGLRMNLKAYEYHVFTEVSEVKDTDGKYAKLCKVLKGEGTYDITKDITRIEFSYILNPIEIIISHELIKNLLSVWEYAPEMYLKSVRAETEFRISAPLSELNNNLGIKETENYAKLICDNIGDLLKSEFSEFTEKEALILMLDKLFRPIKESIQTKLGDNRFEKIPLKDVLTGIIKKLNHNYNPYRITDSVFAFSELQSLTLPGKFSISNFVDVLDSKVIKSFLVVNEFDKILWFNKEKFDDLLGLFILYSKISNTKSDEKLVTTMMSAAEASQYKFEKLLENLKIGEPKNEKHCRSRDKQKV